jgi:hypothetical protein
LQAVRRLVATELGEIEPSGVEHLQNLRWRLVHKHADGGDATFDA